MLTADFTAAAARQAAADGQLEPWIYRYLLAGEGANRALLAGLRKQPRWWLGPLEMELARLSRCCGAHRPPFPRRARPHQLERSRYAPAVETHKAVALAVHSHAGRVRPGGHALTAHSDGHTADQHSCADKESA